MYLYLGFRKNNILAHASNSKKFINDHLLAWSYAKDGHQYPYDVIECNFRFEDKKRAQYILIYREINKSEKWTAIAVAVEPTILKGIGKRKKGAAGLYNMQYHQYRVIMLTDCCYSYDTEDQSKIICRQEQPEERKRYTLKTQSDGSYQLWYNHQLVASCDDYSEVREVLDDDNAYI